MLNLKPPLLSPLLFVLLVTSGCAGGQAVTSSYDAAANRTTYETVRYTVYSASGAEYGSSNDISLRATARCENENCTPDSAQLMFAYEGNQQLSLSGVSGQIVADGSRITWSNAEANPDFANLPDGTVIQVTGQFAVIDLPLRQLRQIATATSLSGSIGGQTLTLRSGVQSGLQSLLEKMNRNASGNASEQESAP